METALFLMYHGQGHFNAVLRAAKVLGRTHRVVFAGHGYFRALMEIHDLEFYSLKTVPFGLGFEKWVNQQEGKRLVYLGSVRDRWNQRLYALRKSELTVLLDRIEPDVVLIDAWQSTDFIVLYHELKERGIRTGFIHTMLPLTFERSLPPLNSPVLPGDTGAIRRAQRKFLRHRMVSEVQEWLRYLGKTRRRMVSEMSRRNALPDSYRSARHSLFAPAFENIHELVFAPKEFDFPYATTNLRHYVGFMTDTGRSEPSSLEFDKLFATLGDRISPNMPLIYCSFGSVAYEHEEIIRGFLEKFVSVCNSETWIAIVSCNAQLAASLKEPGPHVHFFTGVPQLKVLSRASVFITHGGLNSIKESIFHGVPMLVYPVSKDVDHEGNAARVFFHQLGLRGDLKEPPELIRAKVRKLLDSPHFADHLATFRSFDQQYTDERFMHALSQLQPPA